MVADPNAVITQTARRSVRRDTSRPGSGAGSVLPFDPGGQFPLLLNIASAADQFLPWGRDVRARDTQLRAFWPTEDVLAGAIYTICARNAAFDFTLRGPKQKTTRLLAKLHQSNFGEGWLDLIMKVSCDWTTCDNGAFIEIIRADPEDPQSEFLGLSHLDSWRCRRTGNWLTPVVYLDTQGQEHLMKWFQIITLTEFPSPIETARGIQYCGLSRVLGAAQLARDITVYQREKISGRNPKELHLITGFTRSSFTDQWALDQAAADNRGLTRFQMPLLLFQPDPTAKADHQSVSLASLPDGWDAANWFHEMIAKYSLGFGVDYQDLAPLPGGRGGNSSQTQILHLKSRVKGPALFMKALEHKLNFHGVVDPDVQFEYESNDIETEKMEAELRGMQARAVTAFIKGFDLPSAGNSQAFTGGPRTGQADIPAQVEVKQAGPVASSANLDGPALTAEQKDQWALRIREVAAQWLNDQGWLSAEYLQLLGLSDVSPSRVITDMGEPGGEGDGDTPVETKDAAPVTPEMLSAEIDRQLDRRIKSFRRVTKEIQRDATGNIARVIEQEELPEPQP